MRIGRREAKRRLTGLTLPTVLGTGGGGATWTVEPGDKSLARSVLQYLEDRRVLHDPERAELTVPCMRSVQEIRVRLASFISDSQSSELRDPLRAMQAACRQFLTDAPGMETALWHSEMHSQWLFNQVLGEFRARVGTSITIIVETFDIDVDEQLARIMPPSVEDTDDLERERRFYHIPVESREQGEYTAALFAQSGLTAQVVPNTNRISTSKGQAIKEWVLKVEW